MAYAIILDEYQRPIQVQGRQYAGMSLTKALERLSEWAAGIARRAEEQTEEMIAARNREALATIESMMGIPPGRGLSG